MRDNAQTVLNADTQRNTVLSIHMYAVFNTAASITDYLNRFQTNGWPLVIGEFGWQFNAGEVDHDTILAEAQCPRPRLPRLVLERQHRPDPGHGDRASTPAQLTTWGQRIFNGANGIRATAREATHLQRRDQPADQPPPSAPPAQQPVGPAGQPAAERQPRRRHRRGCTADVLDRRPVAGRLPG